jgi:hypothetical protein
MTLHLFLLLFSNSDNNRSGKWAIHSTMKKPISWGRTQLTFLAHLPRIWWLTVCSVSSPVTVKSPCNAFRQWYIILFGSCTVLNHVLCSWGGEGGPISGGAQLVHVSLSLPLVTGRTVHVKALVLVLWKHFHTQSFSAFQFSKFCTQSFWFQVHNSHPNCLFLNSVVVEIWFFKF